MQIHHSGKELIKGKQIQTKLKINNKLSFTLVTHSIVSNHGPESA